jgi:hypothetical protein
MVRRHLAFSQTEGGASRPFLFSPQRHGGTEKIISEFPPFENRKGWGSVSKGGPTLLSGGGFPYQDENQDFFFRIALSPR